jgi:hypothetical protein
LPIFYSFRSVWKDFGTENAHQNLLVDFQFRENLRGEYRTLLESINESVHALSAVKLNIIDLHIILFNSCEFRENRHYESKEGPGDTSALCREVNHWQYCFLKRLL